MAVIFFNCVTLGMYQPCIDQVCNTNRCRILQVLATNTPAKLTLSILTQFLKETRSSCDFKLIKIEWKLTTSFHRSRRLWKEMNVWNIEKIHEIKIFDNVNDCRCWTISSLPSSPLKCPSKWSPWEFMVKALTWPKRGIDSIASSSLPGKFDHLNFTTESTLESYMTSRL